MSETANKKGGPLAHPYLDLITTLGFAGNIGFSKGEARAKSRWSTRKRPRGQVNANFYELGQIWGP